MRKILYLLMLTALFVSCSSDDDNTDPNNGNGNNGMIDEKILGKWKVEYSKTIKPAVYNETTGKPEYNEDASIKEYEGNWGEPNVVPESGMFDNKEIRIEIKKDNNITVSIGGGNPKDVTYKVENNTILTGGYLAEGNSGAYIPIVYYKYSINNNELVIELIKVEKGTAWNPHYIISKYSKIIE